MDNLGILKKRLEAFIRKFYINELLKGLILFVAIGLLYFLFTVFIESWLWLNSTGRRILFWSFVGVEVFLFGRFMLFPLLKLFKISRGISYKDASQIIGKHFPEVNDKLLNLLQLEESNKKSDLLLAGIDQKAKELSPVPFSVAINFRKSLSFLRYAAVPLLIILLIFISGRSEVFSSSYKRVVNYKIAYEPPAPFAFFILNNNLKVRENEELNIEVRTRGKVLPENVSVHYDGQVYFLKQKAPGVFEYTFEPVQENFSFHLSGNNVKSEVYAVGVIKVPTMKRFEMFLNFPVYTGLESKTIEGTGNAAVPEGTRVEWKLNTAATNKVEMILQDGISRFSGNGNIYTFDKILEKDLPYSIATSNEDLEDYERLSYEIQVVKDEYPELEIRQTKDSLEPDTQHFYGKVSDDYGISSVKLVYHETEDEEQRNSIDLGFGNKNIAEFFSSFPDSLDLEAGKSYSFYFEVSDNDRINGSKKVKSRTFSYRRKTKDEEKQLRLQEKSEAIDGMNNSLDQLKLSEEELEDLRRLQKEKAQLNYNDRKKLENFLDRQKQQNEMMKSFNEKLKRNLRQETEPSDPVFKRELEERLEKREEALQENEELLKELEKYSEKIQEENLSRKLEDFSRKSKAQERSLEQLLELTKRYYVREKMQQMSDKLERLSKEQEELSEAGEDNTGQAQDSLSKETEKALDEINELEKENEELQKPMEMNLSEDAEEQVKEEQKEAGEKLKQGDKKGARKEQKKAAGKLMEMSQRMKAQMQMGGMQQNQEDIGMLRQILDNLITFSFEQEDLMEQFKKSGAEASGYATKLKRQDVLKEHFQHVDDSLFALALRNPMVGEVITEKVLDVDYSLGQALDRLAQNEIRQGVGSQQYVVTGANDLAYLLSKVLGNMEQDASPGGGQGQGMQLPDIIKKQKELSEEMKKGMQEGEKGEQKKGQQKKGDKGEGENGESETTKGELFRIFQEQQLLRRALEEELKKESGQPGAGELQKEMKQIENDILEKGFDKEVLRRMQQLEHKLLDLQDAKLEQGNKSERESNTNKGVFSNDSKEQILRRKEYFKTTEILNRQALPLRQIYKQKVKEYFERTED